MLIIGPEEKAKLQGAYERARAKPIPWETLKALAAPTQGVAVLTLENRTEAEQKMERPPSECVELPVGYRVCISFEDQPAGLLVHVSVSILARGKLPTMRAIVMIIDEFGYDASKPDAAWVEEFLIDGQPEGLAANLLFMVEPRTGPESKQ